MRTTADIVEAISLNVIDKIEEDKKNFLRFYAQHQNDDIGRFIDKFLEWKTDKDKSQWVWSMFTSAIWMEGSDFLGSFYSFLVNCFHDDSYFDIEYQKLVLTENYDLIWDKNGNPKTILTTPEDEKGRPVIKLTGDGKRDPLLLIQAMDLMEQREMKYQKEYEEEFG